MIPRLADFLGAFNDPFDEFAKPLAGPNFCVS